MHILLVDDSKVSRMNTLSHLESTYPDFPHSVDTAENGREAVGMCLEKDYDLVIMDVEMPVLNGYDACRSIRQIQPDARVALLTSLAGAVDFKAGREAGCRHYLLKPVNPSELRSILRLVSLTKKL